LLFVYFYEERNIIGKREGPNVKRRQKKKVTKRYKEQEIMNEFDRKENFVQVHQKDEM
jgi:hypothetical protein